MTTTNAIALIRVSTENQGESRLGLERQRNQLTNFAKQNGFNIVEFVEEIESGKHRSIDNRPVLRTAISKAVKSNATLLVASVSRLSRDVQFIASLVNDKKLRFVSAECGKDASPFEIYLRAVFSEEERRKISTRTRGALAAAKRRGVKLGNPNIKKAQKISIDSIKANANSFAKTVGPIIKSLRNEGQSYSSVAAQLNDMKVRTARGGQWYAATVRNIEQRLQQSEVL